MVEPKPPNSEGKTLSVVRWMVELPNGMWLGAWEKEAFAAYRAAVSLAQPGEGALTGWISVEERLPELHEEVICAGQGWSDPFVAACYYDAERREWWLSGNHHTDAHGQPQYPTHWMPLPPPPGITSTPTGDTDGNV